MHHGDHASGCMFHDRDNVVDEEVIYGSIYTGLPVLE